MYKLEEMLRDEKLHKLSIVIIEDAESREPVSELSYREYVQRLARAFNRMRTPQHRAFIKKQINYVHKAWQEGWTLTPTKSMMNYVNTIAQL